MAGTSKAEARVGARPLPQLPAPAADTERFDIMVPYSPSRAWAAVLALALAGSAIGAWAWLARVNTVVRLPGVLVAGAGPSAVLAPAAGAVTGLFVSPGSAVTRGQVIAELGGPDGRQIPVRSAHAGNVIAIPVMLGDQVGPGAPVIDVDPAGAQLHAVLFAGVSAGLALDRGERVTVTYPGGQRAGTISAVGLYPAGPGYLRQLLGASQVTGAPDGAVRLVTVQFAGAWSFPGATLTPVAAAITVASQRPFDAILHAGQS